MFVTTIHEGNIYGETCEGLMVYAVEPTFTSANKVPQCWLGKAKLVGAALLSYSVVKTYRGLDHCALPKTIRT